MTLNNIFYDLSHKVWIAICIFLETKSDIFFQRLNYYPLRVQISYLFLDYFLIRFFFFNFMYTLLS